MKCQFWKYLSLFLLVTTVASVGYMYVKKDVFGLSFGNGSDTEQLYSDLRNVDRRIKESLQHYQYTKQLIERARRRLYSIKKTTDELDGTVRDIRESSDDIGRSTEELRWSSDNIRETTESIRRTSQRLEQRFRRYRQLHEKARELIESSLDGSE